MKGGRERKRKRTERERKKESTSRFSASSWTYSGHVASPWLCDLAACREWGKRKRLRDFGGERVAKGSELVYKGHGEAGCGRVLTSIRTSSFIDTPENFVVGFMRKVKVMLT